MATFRTRTGKHGDTTVTAMVRLVGYPTQTATFPNKKDAQRWATKTEADILEGRTSKDSLGRKRTLGEAIDRYRKEVVPLMRDGSMYGFTLDWWKTNHGEKRLGEVSRGWLVEQRGVLLTGTYTRATPGSKRSLFTVTATDGTPHGLAKTLARTPATCNRYMAALSSVFTQVCGDWQWLQANSNPFTGLGKLPEGKGKGRGYSPQDLTRLLLETAKDPQLHTLVQLALATAARAGELVGLTWSHVELGDTEGRLMFVDTKNGEARIAWVFGGAREALKSHRAPLVSATTPDSVVWRDVGALARPVFPGQWSHKSKTWGTYDYLPRLHKALKAAGITMRRPFHALRHTAATSLARKGANGHQLKALGGWKSNAVDTYVHIGAQDTKELARAHQTLITQEGK